MGLTGLTKNSEINCQLYCECGGRSIHYICWCKVGLRLGPGKVVRYFWPKLKACGRSRLNKHFFEHFKLNKVIFSQLFYSSRECLTCYLTEQKSLNIGKQWEVWRNTDLLNSVHFSRLSDHVFSSFYEFLKEKISPFSWKLSMYKIV